MNFPETKTHTHPAVRRDLEFFPLNHNGQDLVLVRDALGLVSENKVIPLPIYGIMALLDGTRSIRDIQMMIMRQQGGMIVGSDEVNRLVDQLDQEYLLQSPRYQTAREDIVKAFLAGNVRHCSHGGHAYPADPVELTQRLKEVLAVRGPFKKPDGSLAGLISPHIDLSVGSRVYSSAYRMLEGRSPKKKSSCSGPDTK